MRDNVEAEEVNNCTFSRLYAKWNENKVYRPTRQIRFGTTVGSIYYWKYCSTTEPPAPLNKVSGSAPVMSRGNRSRVSCALPTMAFKTHKTSLTTHFVCQNAYTKTGNWVDFGTAVLYIFSFYYTAKLYAVSIRANKLVLFQT
jgi:hypothetical protein